MESSKETMVPTIHASGKDNDDLNAKIEQADSLRDAIKHDKDAKEAIRQDAIANCDIL